MPDSGIESDDNTSTHYRNIVIREVTVRNNGYYGLSLSGADGFKIDSVIAHGNTADGINVGGVDDSLYSQNGFIVKSQSYENRTEDAHGIIINQGHTIAICDSVVHGNEVHGLDISDWPKAGKVSYNITLENNVSYKNDNAGFAVNSDSHHILYLRNLAYENMEGFLCYEGCGHIEYYHNVSIRNRYSAFWVQEPYAFFVDPGDNIIVYKNNITYNNDLVDLWAPGLMVEGDNYLVVATHNNWQIPEGQNFEGVDKVAAAIGDTYYTIPNINTLGEGNVSKNPDFANGDISPPDIHLADKSEMIDSGTVVEINGSPQSFIGIAPDMGANEYGQGVNPAISLDKAALYFNATSGRELVTGSQTVPVTVIQRCDLCVSSRGVKYQLRLSSSRYSSILR